MDFFGSGSFGGNYKQSVGLLKKASVNHDLLEGELDIHTESRAAAATVLPSEKQQKSQMNMIEPRAAYKTLAQGQGGGSCRTTPSAKGSVKVVNGGIVDQ